MPEARDLDHLRTIAAEAVLEGGRVIGRAGADTGAAEEKGTGDYVTRVDRASEEAIAAFLGASTPDIPVVGEELGGEGGPEYWLVDPLDGTTNFLHGFPIFGVSVAFIADGRPAAGAVHCPALDTTFTVARGRGADQDGRPLSVTSAKPAEAIVATGHPFRHKERLPEYLKVFEAALERFEDLRRPGAATLDLSWVAAGVFDGFFELGLSPLGRSRGRAPHRGGWRRGDRLERRSRLPLRRHPGRPAADPPSPPRDHPVRPVGPRGPRVSVALLGRLSRRNGFRLLPGASSTRDRGPSAHLGLRPRRRRDRDPRLRA